MLQLLILNDKFSTKSWSGIVRHNDLRKDLVCSTSVIELLPSEAELTFRAEQEALTRLGNPAPAPSSSTSLGLHQCRRVIFDIIRDDPTGIPKENDPALNQPGIGTKIRSWALTHKGLWPTSRRVTTSPDRNVWRCGGRRLFLLIETLGLGEKAVHFEINRFSFGWVVRKGHQELPIELALTYFIAMIPMPLKKILELPKRPGHLIGKWLWRTMVAPRQRILGLFESLWRRRLERCLSPTFVQFDSQGFNFKRSVDFLPLTRHRYSPWVYQTCIFLVKSLLV